MDRVFSQADLAALYDVFHPWRRRADFDFYLPMIMAARAVLDVGCGTGALLHGAREAGHTGRLCGLDPAEAMLQRARQRSDIEWVRGDLASVGWEREFDLIVMTGHAFQVFVEDDDLRAALTAIRSALTGDGRFAFETRNPAVRAWQRWTPEHAVEVTDPAGGVARMEHRVDTPVAGDLISFTTTFTSPSLEHPQQSRSTLRFLDARSLSSFLTGAGLVIENQFGDFARSPLTDTSPEIVTIARRG